MENRGTEKPTDAIKFSSLVKKTPHLLLLVETSPALDGLRGFLPPPYTFAHVLSLWLFSLSVGPHCGSSVRGIWTLGSLLPSSSHEPLIGGSAVEWRELGFLGRLENQEGIPSRAQQGGSRLRLKGRLQTREIPKGTLAPSHPNDDIDVESWLLGICRPWWDSICITGSCEIQMCRPVQGVLAAWWDGLRKEAVSLVR